MNGKSAAAEFLNGLAIGLMIGAAVCGGIVLLGGWLSG